jgi:hypothetical protein
MQLCKISVTVSNLMQSWMVAFRNRRKVSYIDCIISIDVYVSAYLSYVIYILKREK